MKIQILAQTLFLAPLAAGHGAVTSYIIGGVNYPGYDGLPDGLPTEVTEARPDTIQFPWENYHPTFDVTDPRMRCNGGTSAQLSAPAKAGENVTAVWRQWTHQQGPVMVWLFKCPGPFGQCSGEGKGWFKIDQMGMWGTVLMSNNWATALVKQKLEWSSVIPKNLAPGNYLIRHELLSLHQKAKAQFYAECAQIVVSGDGAAVPPDEFLYSIPTYAPQSDPSIAVSAFQLSHLVHMKANSKQIDIFISKETSYTCPGGPIWTGFSF